MKNYKMDALAHLSKNELLDFILVDQHLVEKLEARIMGGKHTGVGNGADAILDGRDVEIKTQMWNGKYLLRGRGKYAAVSWNNYHKKLESNELVYIVGYDPLSGEVYYRFHFDFVAIADAYKRCLKICADKEWSNFDFTLKHYVDHPSFVVDYIAPLETLSTKRDRFVKNFLHWLVDYHVKNGNPTNHIITERYKCDEQYLYENWIHDIPQLTHYAKKFKL